MLREENWTALTGDVHSCNITGIGLVLFQISAEGWVYIEIQYYTRHDAK